MTVVSVLDCVLAAVYVSAHELMHDSRHLSHAPHYPCEPLCLRKPHILLPCPAGHGRSICSEGWLLCTRMRSLFGN